MSLLRIAWHLSTALLVSAAPLLAQPISSPTEYRPQPFDVQHYELDMTIRNPYSKEVEGVVQIVAIWTRDVTDPSFPVHVRGIGIDSIAYRSTLLDPVRVGDPTIDTFHYRVDLQQPVTNGQRDTLTVYYSGIMSTEGGSGALGGVW